MGNSCPIYNECNAPLCPLDDNIEDRVWYPDEPFCRFKKNQKIGWIKNQKKIKKAATNESHYFTFRMLKQNCCVRKGIKGIHSDTPFDTEEKKIQKWLIKHPPKRCFSDEERKKFVQKMKKYKQT